MLGIKKKVNTVILIVLILSNIDIYLLNYAIDNEKKQEEYPRGSQSGNDSELPVGIFTFFAPNDILIFDNLSLEECYYYNIFIELITPQNVSSVKIGIRDPENSFYDIFENEISFESENNHNFNISFGTALSGNYSIEFYVETSFNVNILINVEKGPKCLYDKLNQQDIDNIIFFDVIKFYNNQYTERNFQLDDGIIYKFYFGRVSSISLLNKTEVRIDINLTDSLGIEFEIYSNELVNNTNELNEFHFGTANEGLYSLKIRLFCQVDYVNMGFAVVGPNHTNNLPTNTSDPSDTIYSIPIEYVIGGIIIVGIFCGVPIVIVVYHRKKRQ